MKIQDLLNQWVKEDIEIMEDAMVSLATFSNNSEELISSTKNELITRLNKCGLNL